MGLGIDCDDGNNPVPGLALQRPLKSILQAPADRPDEDRTLVRLWQDGDIGGPAGPDQLVVEGGERHVAAHRQSTAPPETTPSGSAAIPPDPKCGLDGRPMRFKRAFPRAGTLPCVPCPLPRALIGEQRGISVCLDGWHEGVGR